MKIYTNENNTSTLKLLIAANLAGKKVELKSASFADDVFAGPRALPLLEVDDQLSFFSSNAAAQYLFPILDMSENGQCQQMQEWEATRLQPTVAAVLSAKTVPSDLKQSLHSLFAVLDKMLGEHKYLLGDKLSAADISVWSTLYPLQQKDVKQCSAEFSHLARWTDELGSAKAIQEAIKQWNGSQNGPFGASSALGPPPLATMVSPIGSPDEVEAGPPAEEIEAAKENWLNGHKNLQPMLKQEKVILPTKGRKNILLTSALPYVNNVPHLGNIIGSVLSADIFARYCRLCDYNTLYICGTDEYGTATETKALEEGLTPKQICDKYYEIHNAVYRWFNIGFDYFGRTSTKEQTEISQKLFLKLMENGFVSSQSVDQLLCENCNRFLADRFVEGTCPHPGCLYDNARGDQCDKCGKLVNATELIEPRFVGTCPHPGCLYGNARGDQCDKCGKLVNATELIEPRFVGTCPHPGCLYGNARGDQCDKCGELVNATELIQPRCKVCSHKPTVKPSEQLFIELGQLEPSIRTWIAATEHQWSPPARAVCRAWLKEPLRPRAVTRDLKWGVPVPVERFKEKVFYVWFDAPMGYLSITETATRQYEKWWKPDKEYDVKLYQFMAKDNVPFHTIMFPATLMGINEGHALVSHLFATEYLNYEEGKFSKSRGVGVFGTDAQETGIPSDVWRFYLASIRPETSDSSFSWVELGTRNNSELLNNLGNFCHRSLSFCANSFKGKVPEVVATNDDYELMALVNREVVAYVQHMEKGRLREALRHVLSVSRLGNQHMQSTQPWVLLKGSDDDKQRGATAIALCCQLVALLCTLLTPYIPDAVRKLRQQLNLDATVLRINPLNPTLIQYLPAGHIIGKPEPLFAKLEPEALDKLRVKYAGTQSERANVNGNDKKSAPSSVAELEATIAEQGEKVRKLKSSTKDKAVWQPEVTKLLALKEQLAKLQQSAAANGGASVADLEKAIAEQGDKVRKLKSSTKDKTVWQPEVDKLLDLKKQLTAAQQATSEQAKPQGGPSVAELEKAIAEQGDKVRKLKASTKDKAVWQPEVNTLLDLKKKLASLQVK